MGRQRTVPDSLKLFGITRDGELIGTGLTRDNAETTVSELNTAYPEALYKVVPQPKGKKVNP